MSGHMNGIGAWDGGLPPMDGVLPPLPSTGPASSDAQAVPARLPMQSEMMTPRPSGDMMRSAAAGVGSSVSHQYSSTVAPIPPGMRIAPQVLRGYPNGSRGSIGSMRGLGEEAPSKQIDGHLLGASFIVVGLGAALGVTYANNRIFGGIAGGLYGGATMNLIRAASAVTKGTTDSDHEAAVSGTFALIGASIATYILWKTKDEKAAKKKAAFLKNVASKKRAAAVAKAGPGDEDDEEQDEDDDEDEEDDE